ncbi:hypothetical protein [Larkinella soli]|uniref:hypothetical protein n=1 Tax=Larkinella soli TaxID=1770527 RepID=UPI000FFC88B2|nr:hypothetical protein [Larkinella soli]
MEDTASPVTPAGETVFHPTEKPEARAGIPIIFIHQNYSPYLEFTLRQAVHTNPDSPVYLLGDPANNRFPFLIHKQINELKSADAQRFQEVYRHQSPNGYAYELFCFIRWFLVKELMQQQGYREVFVADSDVMIFSNLTRYSGETGLNTYLAGFNLGADFQWVASASGHSSYWTREGIDRFCALAIQLYTEPRLMAFMEKIRLGKIEKNDQAGFSDMTALYVYYEEYGTRVRNLSQAREGSAFDHNICMSTNFRIDEYEFEAGRKKVVMREGRPIARNRLLNQDILLHTLHFQGNSKNVVHRYYTGKGLLGSRLFRELRYQASLVYRKVKGR